MLNLLRRTFFKPRNHSGVSEAARAKIKNTSTGLAFRFQYELVASVVSDVGCQRETNEDLGRFFSRFDSEGAPRKGSLLLVADGVGGNSAGEIASRTAVDVISRVYYDHAGDAQTALLDGFAAANDEIYRAAYQNKELTGMGTTCTALAINEGSALAAHVGDSRLYLVRDGEIYLMTEDHSVVREMVKVGILSREDARHHPNKNIIISALGSAPEIETSRWEAPLPIHEGDSFVVCSDGLYDLVEDKEINEAVRDSFPQDACSRLVALAKERGGYDNITVGIVNVVSSRKADSAAVQPTREV